jgi:hypothetical protein
VIGFWFLGRKLRILIGSTSGNSSLITISPSLIVFDIVMSKISKKETLVFTALFTFFCLLVNELYSDGGDMLKVYKYNRNFSSITIELIDK